MYYHPFVKSLAAVSRFSAWGPVGETVSIKLYYKEKVVFNVPLTSLPAEKEAYCGPSIVSSQTGLFRGLTEPEFSKIQFLCRIDQRGPAEIVFKEGDDAVDICVVMEGSVELRFEMPGREAGREQTIHIVPPGKAFGWSALTPPYKLTPVRLFGRGWMPVYTDQGARTDGPL